MRANAAPANPARPRTCCRIRTIGLEHCPVTGQPHHHDKTGKYRHPRHPGAQGSRQKRPAKSHPRHRTHRSGIPYYVRRGLIPIRLLITSHYTIAGGGAKTPAIGSASGQTSAAPVARQPSSNNPKQCSTAISARKSPARPNASKQRIAKNE